MFKTKNKNRVAVKSIKKRSITDGLVFKGTVCKDRSVISPHILEGHSSDLINHADSMSGSLVCLLKLNYSHSKGYTQDIVVSKFTITENLTVGFIETLLDKLVNDSLSSVGRVETFKHEFYISNVRVLDKVIETFNLNSFKPTVNCKDPLYITI